MVIPPLTHSRCLNLSSSTGEWRQRLQCMIGIGIGIGISVPGRAEEKGALMGMRRC